MIKTKKKSKNFSIIPVIILIIFSTILYFSIPVLFDYNDLESEIEKKFYKEFKINLNILGKISQKTLPIPYLSIKKSNLNLNDDSQKSALINVDDLKIYTPTKDIYSKSKLAMEGLEIKNSNFKFKFKDIKDIRNHLYYKINKPIKIKNSKLFYLDKDNNTIIISPIYNLEYKINEKNNSKELKIKGNIFDTDYQSLWRRSYNLPNTSYNEIKFKDPNLTFKNTFKFKNDTNFSGSSSINFLNEDIYINYQKNDEKIFITPQAENINQKIKIISTIELNPFNFDTEIILIENNFKFIIDNLIYYLTTIDENSLGNLNGNIQLSFKDIDDEIINEGKINISINEKNISILQAKFKVNGVGEIISKFNYIENDNELLFKSKNIFEIYDIKRFSKKFQITSGKLKNLKKIYFDLEKDIETGEISISNVYINKIDSKKVKQKKYNIKNIQVFRSLLKEILL